MVGYYHYRSYRRWVVFSWMKWQPSSSSSLERWRFLDETTTWFRFWADPTTRGSRGRVVYDVGWWTQLSLNAVVVLQWPWIEDNLKMRGIWPSMKLSSNLQPGKQWCRYLWDVWWPSLHLYGGCKSCYSSWCGPCSGRSLCHVDPRLCIYFIFIEMTDL